MTYRVVITDAALDAAGSYLDYLIEEAQSITPAENWWKKALAAVDTLALMPHRGPKPPENGLRDYTIRAMIVEPCLFLYRVDDTRQLVEVFGFRHGRQEPTETRLPN